MYDWIKCSERMPEVGQEVIIFIHGAVESGAYFSGEFIRGKPVFEYKNDEYFTLVDVTHWQPLPPPPEEA